MSTPIEIFLYFLATIFLLWLTSKPKQETSTTFKIEVNEKVEFPTEIKTFKSTVENINLFSVRPIAPFCKIWAKPLQYIQES